MYNSPMNTPTIQPITTRKPLRGVMTDKQRSFIKSLLEDRKVDDSIATGIREQIEESAVTKDAASKYIDFLLKQPKRRQQVEQSKPVNEHDNIPAGNYAIRWDEDTIEFYKVDRPTKGKWEGYTFVSQRSGDNQIPIRDRQRRTMILNEISRDPKAAAVLYGKELGICSVCNHTLTDPDSIANGIGPVCAKKFA